MTQHPLVFWRWGGQRSGAGRKSIGPRPGVPHRRRPTYRAAEPAHVTLRAVDDLPVLRRKDFFPALRNAISMASNHTFRVTQFSVQTNHVHLLVESAEERALARGMQVLEIRLAKTINRLAGRHGRVWADRYHVHALRTLREVRNALVYVLLNGRKHRVSGLGVGPCSSGAWFNGWTETPGAEGRRSPVRTPQTWLLRVGWRRHGLIRFTESPAIGTRHLKRGPRDARRRTLRPATPRAR